MVLLLAALNWGQAARAMRRRALAHERQQLPAERLHALAIRDGMVTLLIVLVSIATGAEAFDQHESIGDPFLAVAVIPMVASLPFVRRYQGHAELEQTMADERERVRLELLYDVAAAGEDLDLSGAVHRLAGALTPKLGDWGVVMLLDDPDSVGVLAVSRSGDDERDRIVQQMLEQYPPRLDGEIGIGLAVRTGERVLYDDITDELLAETAVDDAQLEMLRSLELGSAAIQPLTARGRRVGAVGIVTRKGRPIDSHTLALLGEVSQHAAPVLDNARLHRELLETERALRFSEAVLRAQGESGVEGLLVVSPEGEMLSYNSRFAEMWGFGDEELAGRDDEEALAVAMQQVVDPEAFLARVHQMYADPVAPSRDEVHFKDGRVFDRYGAPLRLDDGNYLGWAWYFRDITNERRVQQSLLESGERFANLARTLQESLLPPDLPDIGGAEVAARYHPAGDGSDIGGDFYDVFQISDLEWCAVMGDVCGKGAGAARLTALARYTLRAAATRSGSIVRNLETLNGALLRQSDEDRRRGDNRFATASLVRFHADEEGLVVRAGSGGHPPPLVVRNDGSVASVSCRGSLLGMFDQVSFQPAELRLATGEALVLYTDGVTEARRGTEEFGEERLIELLRCHAGRSATEITGAIEAAVLAFQDGIARDDVAILAIRAVAAAS
jgi:PAS domain S-box-containing protein